LCALHEKTLLEQEKALKKAREEGEMKVGKEKERGN